MPVFFCPSQDIGSIERLRKRQPGEDVQEEDVGVLPAGTMQIQPVYAEVKCPLDLRGGVIGQKVVIPEVDEPGFR